MEGSLTNENKNTDVNDKVSIKLVISSLRDENTNLKRVGGEGRAAGGRRHASPYFASPYILCHVLIMLIVLYF